METCHKLVAVKTADFYGILSSICVFLLAKSNLFLNITFMEQELICKVTPFKLKNLWTYINDWYYLTAYDGAHSFQMFS